jgi:dUTP pyrophosphatase
MDPKTIDELFTYHPPTDDQKPRYTALRLQANVLAHRINQSCPDGPDKSAAIRLLRECVMTANASIALERADLPTTIDPSSLPAAVRESVGLDACRAEDKTAWAAAQLRSQPSPSAVPIRFRRVGEHALPLPRHETASSAGLDLRTVEDVAVHPGTRVSIRTGFAIEIPEGFEGTARPRSSMSKKGLDTRFGTVDSDYRGELICIVANSSGETIFLHAGDRIAQLVISPVLRCAPVEASELTSTVRGEGGFGSTGQR